VCVVVRRIAVAVLAIAIALGAAMASSAQAPIRVIVNGRTLRLDQPPVIAGGRVLVPLRGVFEGMGAFVRWKDLTQTVVIVRSATYVSLRVGERTASVNGKSVSLDVPAQLVRGRVLVPLRFIGEALGAQVAWQAATRTVVITAREQSADVGRAEPIIGVQVPTGTPSTDLGERVAVERGRVVIRLARSEFRAGDRIGLTVANGLDRTIYSDDFKTECSIVTLERQVASRWDPITGCALGRPTMTVAIGSGRGRTITIDPRSMHLQKAAAGAPLAFGAGTYRITFRYRFSPQMGAGEQTVSSATFQVR
jgi:hypothetical protein